MREPAILRIRHCLHEVIRLANMGPAHAADISDPTVQGLHYYWGKYCELAQVDEQWHARRLEEALRAGALNTIVDMAHMYLGHL